MEFCCGSLHSTARLGGAAAFPPACLQVQGAVVQYLASRRILKDAVTPAFPSTCPLIREGPLHVSDHRPHVLKLLRRERVASNRLRRTSLQPRQKFPGRSRHLQYIGPLYPSCGATHRTARFPRFPAVGCFSSTWQRGGKPPAAASHCLVQSSNPIPFDAPENRATPTARALTLTSLTRLVSASLYSPALAVASTVHPHSIPLIKPPRYRKTELNPLRDIERRDSL